MAEEDFVRRQTKQRTDLYAKITGLTFARAMLKDDGTTKVVLQTSAVTGNCHSGGEEYAA